MKSVLCALLLLIVIPVSTLPALGQFARLSITPLNTPPFAPGMRNFAGSRPLLRSHDLTGAHRGDLFVDAPEFATGYESLAVAVGDFNGDGNLDLAVANYCGNDPTCQSDGTVSILLGNGDGTFRKVADYAAQGGSSAVAIADFNGDGKLDLAVVNSCEFALCNDYSTQGTVSILLGNGDGTFRPAVSYETGSNSNSVAVGDFNRDGIADLAVTNLEDGTVSILLGNGNGTFHAHVDYQTGFSPDAVTVADFNRDGKLDLAVANCCGADDYCGGGSISILSGNGDGTFQQHRDYKTPANATSVAVGDLNGDSNLDLAVANYRAATTNSVSILLGNGDGTFRPGM